MAGWGKVVAGAVLGVVGTVYATNEEFRKQLPQAARDLPVTVRNRFQEAVSAAREASSSRREEILRDLEEHGGPHGGSNNTRVARPEAEAGAMVPPGAVAPATPADVDETRPLPRIEEE